MPFCVDIWLGHILVPLKALESVCAGLKSIYVIAAGCSIRFSPGALRHPAFSARIFAAMPAGQSAGDESTLFHAWFSCRFKSFLKYCLKTGFQRVFTSVSTFPHFPRYCGARSGERGSPDGRSPSWPTRTACIAPAAPSASRRRSSAPAPAAGPCVSRRITVHRDNAEADALRRAAQTRDNVCAPLPAVHTDHIARKL